MPELNDIDKRLVVLETQFMNMEHSLEAVEAALTKNTDLTAEVKTRIDRQNGAIPHMSDNIASIAQKQETMMEQINAITLKDAKSQIKLNMMYAFFTAVGAGVLGFVIKSVLG